MARPTISQRIALEGGDQIKRALSDIDQAGEWCVYIVYDDGPATRLISDVSHFTISANAC